MRYFAAKKWNKLISIGNRMNASAFRDIWARVWSSADV